MKNKIKVSVIVPVYNVENYLRRCIESLLNQTIKDIEVIAINDGSTDSSLDILKEYSNKDNRIKIIDKENNGVSKARNNGISMAIGEHIMFVDSDDWIDTNMIEKMYNLSLENECDVVMCSYVREYGNESKIKVFDFPNLVIYDEKDVKFNIFRKLVGPIGEETSKPEHLDSLVMACTKLYRTDLIIKNNLKFTDTELVGTEDCLFNVNVFKEVKKAIFLNEPLYHYWKGNKNSLTSSYNKNLIKKWTRLFRNIEEVLNQINAEPIFYKALKNRICMSTLGLGLNECNKSNNISNFKKIRNINCILNEEKIVDAFNSYDMKYLPIYWKVFYLSNKYKLAILSYFILKSINILRRWM